MARKRTLERIILQLVVDDAEPWEVDASDGENQRRYEAYALEVDKRLTAEEGICESLEWVQHYDDRCQFCGQVWAEDSEVYNGGCCEEDELLNPERCTLTVGAGIQCTLTSNHGGMCK